jgi:glyoxylase-like metal-dependent hydrolase (beta-lactamase superfamily II)
MAKKALAVRIKLYILANGMIMCDKANLIAMSNLGTKDNPHRMSDWVESPVYSVLVEHPDGLVLFDTACHPQAMQGRWDEASMQRTPYSCEESEQLLNSLNRLGLSPNDIDHVVLSHLHEDHAGCLEFFTRSKVYVNDAELTQTLKLYALRQAVGGYILRDIEAWLQKDIHWNVIEEDIPEYDLLPGIRILNFGPGHTFGMMGLQVDLPNTGTVILPSDAINTAENLGPPIRYPGLAYDTRGYFKTIRRIADLAQKTHAQIWFSHDAAHYKTLKKSDEGCYD